MINSDILKSKNTIISSTEESYKNLGQKTFPRITTPFRFSIITVSDEFEFRPTSLIWSEYQSSDYWDLFYKINGIANPLDIQTGDVLIRPDEDFLYNISLLSDDRDLDFREEVVKSLVEKRKDSIRSSNRRPVDTDQDEGEDDGIEITEEGIVIDTSSTEIDGKRREILKAALKVAKEEDNTVLSKQLASILKCDI